MTEPTKPTPEKRAFRVGRRAAEYAQQVANTTNHLMAIEHYKGSRRWVVADYGQLPEPPKVKR